MQTSLATYLRANFKTLWTGVEVRVQVRPDRFRVPDVTLVGGPRPTGKVIQEPPLTVVEVLSPDDRAEDLQEKIDDYLAFAVQCVWVINPRTQRAYVHTVDGGREARDGSLRTIEPRIEVPISALFE